MEVIHDERGSRFVIDLGGEKAVLSYNRTGGALDFYSTYVPENARHRGIAEKLVETGFRYAKEEGLKVIPTCSYVASLVRRRTEFQALVA